MKSREARLQEQELLERTLKESVEFELEVQSLRPETLHGLHLLLQKLSSVMVEPSRVLLSEIYSDGVSFCVVFKQGFALDFSTVTEEGLGATLTVSEVCATCTIIGYRTAENTCSACGAPAPQLRGTVQDCGELELFFYRPREVHSFSTETWEKLAVALRERLITYGMPPLETLVAAEELCLFTATLLELLEGEFSEV